MTEANIAFHVHIDAQGPVERTAAVIDSTIKEQMKRWDDRSPATLPIIRPRNRIARIWRYMKGLSS